MLEVKNISYSVIENGEQKNILKNVSFVVEPNQNFIITGHNGSGKSTLLKIIMGIIKPTSGRILFEGKSIDDLTLNERANLGIAYGFQLPVAFKGMTVKRMLELAGRGKYNVDFYCQILSKLGLCAREYLDREVGSKLSGGEQKRIEIATVLARDAKLNLFDEPEAGIDIWSFDALVNVFKNKKATNIIVSHQQKLLELADKVLVLKNGEITQFGNAEEVLNNLNVKQSCARLRRVNG